MPRKAVVLNAEETQTFMSTGILPKNPRMIACDDNGTPLEKVEGRAGEVYPERAVRVNNVPLKGNEEFAANSKSEVHKFDEASCLNDGFRAPALAEDRIVELAMKAREASASCITPSDRKSLGSTGARFIVEMAKCSHDDEGFIKMVTLVAEMLDDTFKFGYGCAVGDKLSGAIR